ncbi:Serine/threonine-protein kinase PknD [Thalassoglobus neptunius]|uniref:Serine/threonine-protein kinase PknD n=1 Tax=Thalassoglobus neptunius TaxID=1938619 RepID=A0A5C5X5Y3_9PLAN|nr:serine/threonine-protein kinase [Thalassoglobus neptunius]TWT57605.1 Serine/threonine-protein kinase PknD [Thalassoglobus neptunius]
MAPIWSTTGSSFQTRLFPQTTNDDSGSLPSVTGMQLGHFVIEERIGRGGMGAVFRAIDQRLDRVVALKVLSPSLSSDSEAIQRFQNEARAAARLDHDNISRVHFIGEEHGLHFIAFEFVTGTNVRNFILQKGRLRIPDVVNYTLQIAEALRHTSAANVVHRDIKPSNIIISPTGRAKLVDLGLARHQSASGKRDLTVAGTALGTFDYISPEQAIDARNVDVRSDIYSLGCTVYHMLTGEPPYPSGTMFQKVVSHHGSVAPNPAERNRLVPPQLARVVQRMMASNPDERYASADALVNDLVQIAEHLGLQPTNPDTTVWTTPLYKARNPYWDGTRTWMAVALVLLLIVFLVDRLQPNRDGDIGADSVAANLDSATDPLDPESTESQSGSSQTETNRVIIPDDTGVVMGTQSTPTPTNQSPNPRLTFPTQIDGLSDAVSGTIPELIANSLGTLPSQLVDSTNVWRQWDQIGSTGNDSPSTANRDDDSVDSGEKTFESDQQTTSVAASSSASEPYLIRVPGSDKTKRAATLSEAFAVADNNSVVEIRVNGPVELQTDPVQISNKRVRLRSSDGFQPVVRFDLRDSLARQPYESLAAAIELGTGGAIEIYEIDLELVVDTATSADLWTFFKMGSGSEVVTRWSTMTLINPTQRPATFFEIAATASADISSLMPDRMVARETSISVQDSILRGQADVISQRSLAPADIRFEETAMNVTGAVLRVDGENAHNLSMDTDPASITSTVSIQHVTALTGEGLFSASAGDHGTLGHWELNVRNNIFRIADDMSPLIFLEGHLDSSELLDRFTWMNHSDPNFLIGTTDICLVDSISSFLLEPEQVSASELRMDLTRVGEGITLDSSSVQSSESAHLIQPIDFYLETGAFSTNPAVKAASDGRDVGVDWTQSQLPSVLPRTSFDISD